MFPINPKYVICNTVDAGVSRAMETHDFELLEKEQIVDAVRDGIVEELFELFGLCDCEE